MSKPITNDSVYIHLIRENIKLIKILIDKSNEIPPFNAAHADEHYTGRAQHLQKMALFGITFEFLLKRILIKWGFSIFETESVYETQAEIKVSYSKKTISFRKLVRTFYQNMDSNYFDQLKDYYFNTNDVSYIYVYLESSCIRPRNFFELIQHVRNNYVHDINSHGEWNGIIWYMYDYLIWLASKEFPNEFHDFDYIGASSIVELFPKLPQTSNS